MKNIVISLVLLSALCVANAQQTDRKELLNKRIDRTTRMKKIGVGFAVGGTCLTALGVASIVKSVNVSNNSYNDYSDIASVTYMTAGVAGVIVGVEALATGTILAALGHAKRERYKRELDRISMNFYYTPYARGVFFSYRF